MNSAKMPLAENFEELQSGFSNMAQLSAVFGKPSHNYKNKNGELFHHSLA